MGISLGGLASGLDINNIINQLVELERQPIVQQEERINNLERVRNAWRDVNTRLRNLRTTVQELIKESNFLSKLASSTNPAVVQAAATSAAENATYELTVSQLATRHTIAMENDIVSLLGKSATEAMGLTGKFLLNGEEIEVESGDSLSALKNKINSSEAGVEASIIAGHLILKSNVSGAGGEIQISHVSGDDLLNTLKIYDSTTGSFYNETIEAQDARFTLNGITITRSGNEIKDLITGVTFTLYGESAESTYIRISTDTEKAVAAVGSFVEQYNSVNDFIREKLQKPESVHSTVSSKLKNAEKDDDNDRGIGLLQGNTTLMKIERTLRNLIHAPVSDYRYETEDGWEQKKYYSFASVGVTTIDKEGYLQFNADRLISALEDDPEAVYELFKFEIKDEDGGGTGQFDGLGVTLDNYLKRLLITEQDEQGRTLYPITVQQEQATLRRIEELERRIEIREERLLRYEERLIRQFTSLEKYISTMQSQSDNLANLIRQLTGFKNEQQ